MKKISEVTKDELVFSIPLYNKIEVEWKDMKKEIIRYQVQSCAYNEYITYVSEDYKRLINFISEGGVIYGTCPNCKKGMSFSIEIGKKVEKQENDYIVDSYSDLDIKEDVNKSDDMLRMIKKIQSLLESTQYFIKNFTCPICLKKYCVVYGLEFQQDKLFLIKIGQYPSLNEFSEYNTNIYEKLLKKMGARDDLRNAKKMHTDGYNIAAYVYLRRVLEKIIMFIFNENGNEIDCSYDEFKVLHIEDKIKILKGKLPDYLYDNSIIYSIVSAGIHTLEEDICAEYFDVLYSAIEIIIGQYEAKRKEMLFIEKTSNGIQAANTKISQELRKKKRI